MTEVQKRASLEGIMPFFIVTRLQTALDFYFRQLGFLKEIAIPEEGPFFAIVCRDQVRIMLKEIGNETRPQQITPATPWARWDAFIYTPDPDRLFEELRGKDVRFHRPISDTEDGLRAFEIFDCDGYVLCFGRRK